MTKFRDLSEFFDPRLRLPVDGKTYVIEPVDAETGLLCRRLMEVSIEAAGGGEPDTEGLEALVLDDDQEKDLYKRILGGVYDELFTDKLDWPVIQHIGTTALVWVVAGVDAAVKHWESAGEAPAPNRETRRAAAARSTRSRGSVSGTTPTTASASKRARK
ncbi:hypothetical protein GCM10010466_40070 [Planomonospora alba]|uniref:DUF7426 domain-containing protein n=1 Tax=Planomonospora alba TaxID=161354 RepID=A0ABP6NDW6_9ACTN